MTGRRFLAICLCAIGGTGVAVAVTRLVKPVADLDPGSRFLIGLAITVAMTLFTFTALDRDAR